MKDASFEPPTFCQLLNRLAGGGRGEVTRGVRGKEGRPGMAAPEGDFLVLGRGKERKRRARDMKQ